MDGGRDRRGASDRPRQAPGAARLCRAVPCSTASTCHEGREQRKCLCVGRTVETRSLLDGAGPEGGEYLVQEGRIGFAIETASKNLKRAHRELAVAVDFLCGLDIGAGAEGNL